MPLWKPEPIWTGQDVFIIGGGPSLCGFDWSLLIDEKTIGCNNAFRLGPEVCDICVFCDRQFIFSGPNKPRKGFYDELAKFPNPVVTNDNQLATRSEPWLKFMPRLVKGFSATPDALCYNCSTGAAAVNLAALLGAAKIYLLGFDMQMDEYGKPNYHEYIIDKPQQEVYDRIFSSFGNVVRGMREKFPGVEVYNVNNKSRMTWFQVLDPKIFWAERKKQNEECKISVTL